MQLDALLRAHEFMRIERPPELWEADTDDVRLLPLLGEMIAAGLAAGVGLADLTLNASNVVVEPFEDDDCPQVPAIGEYVALTVSGPVDFGPDAVWSPDSGATGILMRLGERLAAAGARFAYVRHFPAEGTFTVFFSRASGEASLDRHGRQQESRMSEQPSPEKILQTGLAFWASKTLLSAVELGLFTELARSPQQFDALVARLGLHPRSARDFLDALVALGFLNRAGDRYENTRETDLFLDRQKPSYVGGILEMANHRLYPFWANLTEALRTGKPQNEVKTGGPGVFETLYSDPARLKQFLASMTGISHGANLVIASAFPWKDYRTFADVGTAQGDLAAQIARVNTHLRGVGFDLPVVGPIFQEYVVSVGVADRVTFVPGSFFEDDLPKADVVLMGHILHDWDLPTKKMLIAKAYDAIPDGGALVVYEAIIDDDRSKNAFGLMMSLNMLIETPGGFDYTGADCSGWMKEAGFSSTRVQHLVGPDSMVIGIK